MILLFSCFFLFCCREIMKTKNDEIQNTDPNQNSSTSPPSQDALPTDNQATPPSSTPPTYFSPLTSSELCQQSIPGAGLQSLKNSVPSYLEKVFYFSDSEGDDTHSESQAQNPSTPWKSLARLQEYLKPGGSCFALSNDYLARTGFLFKRGDQFEGSVEICSKHKLPPESKVYFGSYGSSSQRPLILGSVALDHQAWITHSGNIVKYESIPFPVQSFGLMDFFNRRLVFPLLVILSTISSFLIPFA